MKVNAKIAKGVRELYEWALGAIDAPLPPQTTSFLLPLLEAVAAGNKWEYDCKTALPPPPHAALVILETWTNAPVWLSAIINAAKNRVKPVQNMVNEMGTWLEEYDETGKKIVSGRGRQKKDRTILREWINKMIFHGFSRKEGVKMIAEKIEVYAKEGRPEIKNEMKAAIVRVLKGASYKWTERDGSYSVSITLSHQSQ